MVYSCVFVTQINEVTRMQQEKKQQHQKAENNFMLMKIQSIRDSLRFRKLMIVF